MIVFICLDHLLNLLVVLLVLNIRDVLLKFIEVICERREKLTLYFVKEFFLVYFRLLGFWLLCPCSLREFRSEQVFILEISVEVLVRVMSQIVLLQIGLSYKKLVAMLAPDDFLFLFSWNFHQVFIS